MKITSVKLFTVLFLLIQLFNLSVLLNWDFLFFRAIYGTLFLLFVPGFLAYLALKVKTGDFWKGLVYSVGLSIFFLMFTGFVSNQIYLRLGIGMPLSLFPYIVVFNLFLLFLLEAAFLKNKKIQYNLKISPLSYKSLFIFNLSLLLPILAVLGAIALNNNRENIYTVIMLGIMGVLVAVIFLLRKKIGRNVLLILIYLFSLSLLFMTSMRGWYTTGHDNQMEFFVFQLTKKDYGWDISEYRDPYNASLSITILPTVLQTLLNMNDLYIYKIIYQIVFAFAPVAIFLFFEKYADRFLVVLSLIVFISFPTFVNDMPMLNRQEIATLFYSLLLLLIFSGPTIRTKNKFMFFIFGIGMIVSHYSTTYIAITQLAFVYATNFLLTKIKLFKLNKFSVRKNWQRLSFTVVLSLTVFTLIWNVQLTNTASGLSRVITATYSNIGNVFSQDMKSGGVMYSFFNFSGIDKKNLLEDYKDTLREKFRENDSDTERYFDNSVTDNYEMVLVKSPEKPLTALGNLLQSYNISPRDINYMMRQISAKLVQLFLFVGIFLILFKKTKYITKPDPEYLILVISSVITIAFFIILPVLSLEYGTQRLFQQSLVIAALPLVVGLVSTLRIYIATFIIMLMFLSLTGFIPYITGGYEPQLHLENNGSYYDSFYTQESEYSSMKWLSENYSRNFDVYASPSTQTRMVGVTGVFGVKGIIPQIITKEDYVYLNKKNVTQGIDVVSHKGDLFYYTLPLEFFQANKDLIYNNYDTRIYK